MIRLILYFNTINFRYYGLRKQKAANINQAISDTGNTLQGSNKGGDVAPNPIITVTTPSKGPCTNASPKKVLV